MNAAVHIGLKSSARRREPVLLRLLPLLCLTAAAASGCGYSLAGRASSLPSYIQTIGIPAFTNRTSVFNLETLLTEKVRAELIGRGKYKVLPVASGVDALLTGEVVAASLVPVSFTVGQLASRYAISISARVELQDLHENKVIWENPGLVFRQEYEATSGQSAQDPAAFFGQDTNALDRMSTDFSRTIVSAILEAF